MILGKRTTLNEVNNLNAIRLFLAIAVIMEHAYYITLGANIFPYCDFLSILTKNQLACGGAAVNIFFFISGMLITGSYLRSKSLQCYLLKRIFRIYPAYIAAIIFTFIIIWFSCPSSRVYGWHIFSKSFLVIHDCIFLTNWSTYGEGSGIFVSNPKPNLGNASLWTIPWEFQFYILVSVLGLFCLFKRRKTILFFVAVIFIIYSLELLNLGFQQKTLIRFLCYFTLGICAWLWRDKIVLSKLYAVLCLVALVSTTQFKPWFSIIFPIAACYITLFIGFGINFQIFKFTIKNDLSYGTYLYAYPIQQVFALYHGLRHPIINFLLTTPLSLALAWLSWTFIEKRFLEINTNKIHDYDPGLENN
jgi:peptidoglycan/LPS O-acetylase OafA/YrhL